MKSFFASAAVALSILGVAALPDVAKAATLSNDTTGFASASFESGDPTVRFRSLNTGGELFVGQSDLGVGGNRVEASFTYLASAAFTLNYTQATGTIAASYNGGSAISRVVTPGEAFNALRILMVGPGPDGNYFSLSDLTVNSVAVSGDVVGSTTAPRTFEDFYLSGFGFGDIALTGTISYFGQIGDTQSEGARVEFALGNVAPVPLPAAGWLLLAGLGGLGIAARRRKPVA